MYLVLDEVSALLDSHGYSLSNVILFILSLPDADHNLVSDLTRNSKAILDSFIGRSETSSSSRDQLSKAAVALYAGEVEALAHKDAGWHFSAGTVEPTQLQEFELSSMAVRMRSLALCLWNFLDCILSHDEWALANGKGKARATEPLDLEEFNLSEIEDNELGDAPAPTAEDKIRRHTAQSMLHRQTIRNTVCSLLLIVQGSTADFERIYVSRKK